MSAVYARSQLQVLPTVPDPDQKRVEMLLFPGLWFSHAGQVVSVELVSQPREVSTLVRVQILRPYCSPHHHLVPPGCSSLLNPFSCCSTTPLCNTTGGCALGQYWCHLLEACVPVTSPCSPYNQSPSTGERSYPLPPRYPDIPPFYHLVADLPMRVAPCSEPAHISILPEREISVYPDDILSVQHTGRPGTFLSCRDNASSSSSPWRQSYLSLQGAEWGGWWEGGLSSPPNGGQWVDGVVCDLRVLYVDTLHGHGYISSTGQSELSGFTHIGSISTPISMTPETSAPAPAKSHISGLCMIHPLPDGDNQIHILVDTPVLIVIKILSGKGATSSWLAPVLQRGVPFLPSCPGGLPDSWPGCERDSPDSWFSHMSLVLPSVGVHTLNVSAVNGVSEQSTCVQVCVYEPVAGLSVEPHGHLRMLVDLSQTFTATAETGSSVKYTWVIDELEKFPYEGDTYSVMFKKPAEYKLKVTAANAVSSQTLEVTLTADTMTPLADPEFLSVKEVIAVAALRLYTFRVKVDVSLGVTFRWSFGDGSAQENHTFPAPFESQDRPMERGVRQVYVQDSVSHVYLQPDDYTLTVQVYNQYDNIKRAISVKVRPPLTRILIFPSPPVPLVNQTFLLEASSHPSHYGILYTWNFGDGSKQVQGFHGKVSHVARTTGVYNMTVCANNTLTALTAWVAVAVVEKVSGLQLSCSGPSELKSVTEIKGKVASGSSLHWDWNFGDGSGHKNITDNSVSHVYESPGSYTVRVTVSNAFSQASQSISLEIYRLTISGILPSECSETEKEIQLQALVNGNVSMLTFHWNFGDESPLSVQKGKSVVTHTYSNPGIYNVNVTVLSIVGSVFYDANVCIEAPITGITICPSQDAVAVGEEVCFNAVADSKRQPTGYQFLWFNHSSNSSPIRGLARHCFVYKEEGIHDVSVMASNKVSQRIAQATVAVQKPVSKPSIAHSSQSNTLTVNEKITLWVKSCTGTNVSVQWDFGDGSPLAKSQNVSHVFTSAGRFTVKATASNAVSRDSVNLEVNVLLPVSELTLKISQPFAVVGEETVITAVGNVAGNVNFYWSVDGPATPELGMSHFQYVFPKAGVYQVKVTAQNLVSQQEAAILIVVLERIQGLQISSQSLTSMSYIPTRESVLLTASVTHGSNVTYHWLANQRGVTQTASVGEHFPWFTETPGNISVELTASNGLGKTTSCVSLKAVERVSGARMSTARDTVPLGKYINISVTVETGSDLQYLWNVSSDLSPLQNNVPFLLYVFETLGSCSVSVSVQNVLGSSNTSKHFTVQEEVTDADFQIGGKTHPFFITSNTQVALYGYVHKGNDQHWEWKVVGCTGGAVVLNNNQSVIYTFTDVGVYKVSLNVSNGISWQTVSHRVTIQDTIQGLTLNLSRSTVCAEDHIAFTPVVSKGTNVSFSLAFDEVESSNDLVEVSFTTSTLPVGSHSVTARAWNQVSNSQVSLTVQVVERIGGLRLVNCCSTALEALKEIPFQANVMSGSPTDYIWTIQLEGLQPLQVIGQEVMYTSPGSGSLFVGVMASNGFCSETLNETAIVQLPVREVKIVCDSTATFRGYSVRFSVTVNGGSNLRFQWVFEDSSEGVVITKSSTVNHTYLTAGKYIVKVTAFNNVSQVSTQLLTEVRELQCSLPQVTLVQGQSTILKSRSSYFEASVDIKGCTAYKTMYLWEVFRGSGCGADKTDSNLVTQSSGHPVTLINLGIVTTPLLSLPKQALEVGQYCLGFTVSLQGTPLHLHRTSRLSVVHSSLVPIIRGGSHRLVPSHSDLILDGSESHDPDVDLGEEGELKYHWDFITENSTEWLSQDQDQLLGYNSSRLTVPSRKLQPDRVYLFTLTVQKEGRRPISTTQSVAVSKVAVLPVSVECVSCSTLSSFRVSQSRPIVLSGCCDKCGSHVQYKWSVEDQNGVTLDLNEVTTTGSLSPDLVVRPEVLQEGYNYTFTLNVTHPAGGRWGCASLTLLPNPPPHGGVCTLTPGPGERIRLLETVVTYNCSGWLDEDSESPQLIYILQVASSCPGWGKACPLLTLYRGTQRTFGSLVPLGEAGPEKDLSIISVILQVEDHLGSKVTALNRTITVLRPVDGDGITEWLRNKSQTELWGLLQQGNPQQLIPYSIALTSQLNQVDQTLSEQDLRDRREIRGNVTQVLASLSVSSLQDAAQISFALAQSTAVPSEVVCEGCQENVLESVGRMIRVMEEQTGLGDDTAIDTGRNILHVIGSSLAAVSESKLISSGPHTHSNVSETAVSALDHARALMRILMRSRKRDEEPLSLSAPQISAVGYHGNPSELLCTTDPSVDTRQSNQSNKSQLNPSSSFFNDKPESYPPYPPCQFLIPPSLSAQLQRQVRGSEVVQILLGLEGGSEFLSAANPPISTSLAAMEFTTPQGQPIPIANLDTDRSIRVTLPKIYTVGRISTGDRASGGSGSGSGAGAWSKSSGIDRDEGRAPMVNFTLRAKGWLNFTVRAVKNMDPNAGLYISLNFSLLPGASLVGSGHVRITVATQPGHPASHDSLVRELTLSLSTQTAMEDTIFLSPLLNSTVQSLFVNLTSSLSGAPVRASVCVFSSLCQYYSLRERRWSTEGLRPLEGSTLHSAHCLTQHLTMFGASLFVHPDAVVLLPPSSGPMRNVVVGIVCAVLVLIHFLLGLITHKLDHLESLRLCHVPLCGRPGRYSYRVLVKTGWRRGAGTTAHVGISLYGVTKSGSRHLQREGAFQRSGLDLFHLETDSNLGEVWKIHLWHDNTGLDPSWYVQHVVVWDPQTDHLFYFLVEDWLSVENDRNEGGGTVEKEMLASCPVELSKFRRVLSSQLAFGMLERHLWLSLWERPALSRFMRGQRVTVCALLLHLYLALGAVWYGAVGTEGHSGPVSARLLVTWETVAVGMTIAILVFPLQCLLCFLFRKTHSQVAVDMSVPPSPVCQSVEMDVYLGQSDMSCSSFLSLPGGPDPSGLDGDTPSSLMGSKAFNAEFWNATNLGVEKDEDGMTLWSSCDSLTDLPGPSCDSLTDLPGPSCDSLTDLPGPSWEITSDPLGSSLGPARLLKRKKALMKLCLASPSSPQFLVCNSPPSQSLSGLPPDPSHSHSHSHNLQPNVFTLSEEDLLRSIAAETGNSPSTSDSGRYSPRTTSLSHTQSQGSSSSVWSELSVDKPLYGTEIHNPPCSPTSLYGTGLFRPSSSLSVYSIASTFLPSPSPDSTDSTTRIGVARGKPSWLLPPWALRVIYPLVVLLLGACLAVVGLYGSHFSSSVVLMWLISALSAFLTSALLLEPLKVCVQALFYAVVLRPVDPEVNDRLGQETVIKREGGKQRGKVLPPCGFGLLQAKEEARKVRALRSLMKHCVCHMLFLLVVLMVNYQDSVQETQGRLLHSAVKHSLTTNLNTITGWEGAWLWMDNILVPHLHQNPALHLVGLPRIRCIHTPDHNKAVSLGNSSFTTRQLLSGLYSTHWTTAQLKAVSIDFTQYHRETSLFVCVSVLLEKTQIHTLISSLSIHPLLIPPSSSGPDLQIALMVLLLLSALLFLGVELWAMATAQYVRQSWRWLQLLLTSLSLATAALRFCFLSQAASCLSQHRSIPDSFTEFHSAALLARRSTQISAILLTLLVLKMVGTLRYVRRWVVFGRVLQLAWREMAAVALLMILLLLLFSHTGHMAGVSVLSVLRGRLVLQRLSRAHPVLGPLYALSLLGMGGWLLARLSGAVLLRTYRVVQAEMYRPAMEPHDYEMVEFFIKRLKLWMGLIKAKEFRHRVKFEGMVVPPSRSSQESCLSTISSSLSSPHPLSSALSLGSEDSGVSAPGLDVQPNLDRLLSCVNSLLSRFDHVNQLTADIHGLETQLEEVQSRRRKRGPQGLGRGEEGREGRGVAMGSRKTLLPPQSRISLPSFPPSSFNPITLLSCPPSTNPSFAHVHSSYSESVILQPHPHPPRDTHLSEATKLTQRSSGLGLGTGPSGCPGARQFPRRRAWHSGSSHSADAAQRPPQAPGGGIGVNTKARPCSEEGDRRRASEGLPVKRRAWISEGPETDIV
ncbi:polycystin-1 isoform X2 [Coregonus clupeaformis]|uniref:polycystin-1 isoform X2 n=1 Tax=Coregonus clupeaformis TaxID=59861 RepID=UPI001E1C616A|nr:polycystin-1 isoform X2 [Coregonus clupeaformis]